MWVGWGAQALCPAPQGCSWIPPEQGPFLPLWETCPSKYGSPRGPRGEGFPLGWRPGAVRGLHTVLGSLCSGRAPHAVALSLERATCRTDPESRGRLRPPLPSPVPARPRPVHLRPGFTAGGGAVRLLRPVGTGRAPPAAPSLTWLPWPVCVRGCCSIWGPMPSVGGSSPSPAVFLLLQGLTGPGGPAGSRLSRQVGRRSLLCWSDAGMSRGPWVART